MSLSAQQLAAQKNISWVLAEKLAQKILTGEYPRQDGTFRFGSNLLTGYFDQVQAKLDLTKTVIGEVWDTFPQMTETRVRNAVLAPGYPVVKGSAA